MCAADKVSEQPLYVCVSLRQSQFCVCQSASIPVLCVSQRQSQFCVCQPASVPVLCVSSEQSYSAERTEPFCSPDLQAPPSPLPPNPSSRREDEFTVFVGGVLLNGKTILRHHLRAPNQGHHTINRLEETDVERGSARRSFLKGRERAIVNQTNIGTVLNATLGKLSRDGVECIWALPFC